MSQIQLKEFGNYRRFVESQWVCPDCETLLLEDRWPPNYGGGSISSMGNEYGGNTKVVCTACKNSRSVSTYKKFEDGKVTVDTTDYSEPTPLVEKDGVWLTPHDVFREEYKTEHGEYPRESYA